MCTAQDCNTLQQVIETNANYIISTHLLNICDIIEVIFTRK